MRRIVPLLLALALLCGCGAAQPGFARFTADDALRAFIEAGLRTEGVQPIGGHDIGRGVVAPAGQSFAVGQFAPKRFYVLEYRDAAARDAARDKLLNDRGYGRWRFLVHENLILVSTESAPEVAQRYETVFAALR